MLKLIFYVPASHLEIVKNAVFAAGAGKEGNYSHCSWQTLGTRQYKALSGSHPAVGEKNELTDVDEYKVETICPENLIDKVIKALINAHPYEAPVYDAWPLTHNASI